MKNQLARVILLGVLMGFSAARGAQCLDLEELTGIEQARLLKAGEEPVAAQFKNSQPCLVPRNDTLQGLIEALGQDLNPSVMVETLHLYKKPGEADKNGWSTNEKMELCNGILALSTLTGLQYYSISHGGMRTLYARSQVIDGPDTKKPLPDPVFFRPPEELTIYARQKDLSFGDNIYQYDYYCSQDTFIFVQKNLTSMTAGIIPAVGKNNLRSVFAVLDAGDYLLVYAASMAKAASIPGMNDRVGKSFANRAEAVFRWFSVQAGKAFRDAHL